MSKGPGKGTEHHRKPSSIGGTRSHGNISKVPRYKHEAWHGLFSNLSAPDILEEFKKFYKIFSGDASDEKCKQQRAWEILFSKMSLEEILLVINTTWLDLDYYFVLKPDGTIRCVHRK